MNKKSIGEIPDNIVCVDSPFSAHLPNISLFNLYKGIDSRRLYIDTEIDEYLLDSVAKIIMQYNKEDKDIDVTSRNPIHIYFNSFGGRVDIANSLIDIISLSKTPIIGINMGSCCSAAALIFLSCHTRMSLKRAEYLIHQGSASVAGTTNQVLDMADNIKLMEKDIKNYIIERTTIDDKLYKKNEKKEWYLTIAEQEKYGIIHKVVDNLDEIL